MYLYIYYALYIQKNKVDHFVNSLTSEKNATLEILMIGVWVLTLGINTKKNMYPLVY